MANCFYIKLHSVPKMLLILDSYYLNIFHCISDDFLALSGWSFERCDAFEFCLLLPCIVYLQLEEWKLGIGTWYRCYVFLFSSLTYFSVKVTGRIKKYQNDLHTNPLLIKHTTLQFHKN